MHNTWDGAPCEEECSNALVKKNVLMLCSRHFGVDNPARERLMRMRGSSWDGGNHR